MRILLLMLFAAVVGVWQVVVSPSWPIRAVCFAAAAMVSFLAGVGFAERVRQSSLHGLGRWNRLLVEQNRELCEANLQLLRRESKEVQTAPSMEGDRGE